MTMTDAEPSGRVGGLPARGVVVEEPADREQADPGDLRRGRRDQVGDWHRGGEDDRGRRLVDDEVGDVTWTGFGGEQMAANGDHVDKGVKQGRGDDVYRHDCGRQGQVLDVGV